MLKQWFVPPQCGKLPVGHLSAKARRRVRFNYCNNNCNQVLKLTGNQQTIQWQEQDPDPQPRKQPDFMGSCSGLYLKHYVHWSREDEEKLGEFHLMLYLLKFIWYNTHDDLSLNHHCMIKQRNYFLLNIFHKATNDRQVIWCHFSTISVTAYYDHLQHQKVQFTWQQWADTLFQTLQNLIHTIKSTMIYTKQAV